MTTKAPRKRTGPKQAKTKGGEPIPLITPIPGGLAHWYAPGDLTPRRSREYELMAAEMAPLIERTVNARQVEVDGQPADVSDILSGPTVGLGRAELQAFLDLTEAATWAHLKSWTLDEDLPADADALLDLPRPLYEALTGHGAKLMAAVGPDAQFTAAALPADMDEVDEDLPTSA